VFVEEKGVQAGTFLGHGSLWTRGGAHERLQEAMARLRSQHGYAGPLALAEVNAESVPFFGALLERFFAESGLMAHMLITRLATSQAPPRSSARRSLGMLLRHKARFFSGAHQVHIVSDEPRLQQGLSLGEEHQVTLHPEGHPAARVGALIAELVVTAWADHETTPAQDQLQAELATHLGWPDLRSDTTKRELKLNVWAYYDPTVGVPREFQTRPVTLRKPPS
jgi:hypothetical protein